MITVNQQKFRDSMRELFNDNEMFDRKQESEVVGFKSFSQMLHDACVRIDAASEKTKTN